MSRVASIVSRIRINLGDKKETRWTDNEIIDTINEGLLDFVSETKTIKSVILFELEQNINIYNISNIAMDILKVQYLNKTIPVYTEDQLVKLDSDWENTIGTEVKCVMFDDLPKGQFKIYPRIQDLAVPIVEQNQVYGALIDITADADLFSILESDAVTVSKYMKVYYVKRPNKITISTVDLDMELDEDYDTAMVLYTTGILLRGDQDAQNRSFSAEQLQLYGAYVRRASESSASNNNSANKRRTVYNGGIQ